VLFAKALYPGGDSYRRHIRGHRFYVAACGQRPRCDDLQQHVTNILGTVESLRTRYSTVRRLDRAGGVVGYQAVVCSLLECFAERPMHVQDCARG
jgi:hypothetical protein